MNKIGIIYKITNITNNKIYIGQTSCKIENKEKGAITRFKSHCYSALYGKNSCPHLGNAIKKFGKESFIVETIEYCDYDIKKLNELEIKYIKQYDSTNKDIGYNISSGGGGASVIMTENKRLNISKGQLNEKNFELVGIVKKYRDGKHVGYRAQRKQNGKKYEKLFTDSSKSLDENLKLAKQCLIDLKNNNISKYKKFNKVARLPQNIYILKKIDIDFR